MSSTVQTSWRNAGVLLGLVGILGVILYWQISAAVKAHEQEQAAIQRGVDEQEAYRNKSATPYTRGIHLLEKERLPEAEAGASRIAALRKERKDATRWPDLVILIPIQSQSLQTVQADYLEYRLRELTAYQNGTRDIGAAKTAGEAFLETYLRAVAVRQARRPNLTAARMLGQAAIKAGSRDPMVRSYLAFCDWSVDPECAKPDREWEAALRELPQTKYPKIVQVFTHLFLRDAEEENDPRTKRWKDALPTISAWIDEESETPRWLPSFCESLWSIWNRAEGVQPHELMAACTLSQKVDPYITHTFLGTYLLDSAWKTRGDGWANEVKPEAWELFNKDVKAASSHLQYAWSLHPELPQAPMKMISVASAGGDVDKPYFWFARTLEARFDEPEAFSRLGFSLTSRWQGSRQSLYTFGHNCVETLRFDTIVPYFAIDVLQMVQKYELAEGETLAADPSAMKLMRRFLELRQSFRSSGRGQKLYEENGSHRPEMLLALETLGMEDEAAKLVRESEGKFDWAPLQNHNRPGRFLAARRLAIQTPLKDRVQKFDHRLRQPENQSFDAAWFDELEAERRDLQKEVGLDQQVTSNLPDYFAHAEIMIKQLRAFHAGEWFPLELNSQLLGWEPYADNWSVDANQSVTLSNRQLIEDQILLRPLANFPLPMEAQAELELLEPSPYIQAPSIGWACEGFFEEISDYENLFSGYVDAQLEDPLRTGKRTRRDSLKILFGNARNASYGSLSTPPKHRLRLRLWRDYAELEADGKWYALSLPKSLRADGWLCFGESFPDLRSHRKRGGAIRFQNLKLRQLNMEIPPLSTASFLERADYWDHRLAQDPDDPVTLVNLMEVRLAQGRDADVIALAERASQTGSSTFGVERWKALSFMRQGRYAEAKEAFERAIQEVNEDPERDWQYAELLAAAPIDSLRDGDAAMKQAHSAVRRLALPRRVFQAQAAAYAELNQFDKAVEMQLNAMEADADVADTLSPLRLEAYRSGRPWRLLTATAEEPGQN